jgi:hypothetical protein
MEIVNIDEIRTRYDSLIKHIERGATTLLVQTPDEFLYEFNSLSYNKPHLIKKIRELIDSGTIGAPLNQGGNGVVYNFGPNHILKISNLNEPLDVSQINTNLKQLYSMFKNNNLIYKIQNTLLNKEVVFCPNYLSEGIIGSLILSLSEYTPSFMKINGTLLDNINSGMYLIGEKLTPFEYNETNYFYSVFQLCFGLYVAQIKGRYVHYDLHMENIMSRQKSSFIIQKYILENGKYIYSKHLVDSVIIDYGHNRYETEEHVITPRLQFIGVDGKEKVDAYGFNKYYDVFSMLYFQFIKARNGNMQINHELIKTLICAYLKINITEFEQFLENNILSYGFDKDGRRHYSWRPFPQNFYFNDELPMDISEFLLYLYENNFQHDNSFENYEQLNNYLDRIPFIASTVNIIDDKIKTYGFLNSKNPLEEDLYPDKFMNIEQYKYKIMGENITIDLPFCKIYNYHIEGDGTKFRTSYANFNRTLPLKFPLNASTQYMSIAEIKQPSIQNNLFKFESDCCRLDPRTYFQNNIFDEGISINASYFNIGTDFEPVGLYKTHDYETDNPIPTEYEQFYVAIVVNNVDDDLEIITLQTARRNKEQYKIIITAGPVLVLNHRKFLQDSDLENHPELNCRGPTNDMESELNYFSEGLYNCGKIKPGELKHVSNPNPRTALGVGHNSLGEKCVYFITIEGRGERGTGMDVSQLGDFLVNEFSTDFGIIIDHAVNLDGGRSSSMTYLHDDEITIMNPFKKSAYPVGNILSFVRRKDVMMDIDNDSLRLYDDSSELFDYIVMNDIDFDFDFDFDLPPYLVDDDMY